MSGGDHLIKVRSVAESKRADSFQKDWATQSVGFAYRVTVIVETFDTEGSGDGKK